jgi:hypothetical protein
LVQLRGLSSANLNGKKATVAGPKASAGRLPVTLVDDPSRTIAVRETQLFVKSSKLKHQVERARAIRPPPVEVSTAGAINPAVLPRFKWTKEGDHGRGHIREAFERMVAYRDQVRSHRTGAFTSVDQFKEAQSSLLLIAHHVQDGENLVIFSDDADTEALFVYVRDVRVLPDGAPGLVCGWVHNSKVSNPPKPPTLALLSGEAQFGWPAPPYFNKIAATLAEIKIIRHELESRQRQLDPRWRAKEDRKLNGGWSMSFLTLLEIPVPPTRKTPAYTLVSADDRHVDVHVPDCSIPITTFGTSEDSCVICLEPLKSATHKALPGCGHMFHTTCIDEWVKRDTTCPNCKKENAHCSRGGVQSSWSVHAPFDVKSVTTANASDTVRKFERNRPFILKLSIPLKGQAMLNPSQSTILAYSEGKKLELYIQSSEYCGAPLGLSAIGTTSPSAFESVLRCVHSHGTGKGEEHHTVGVIPHNVRGYCQAVVRSAESIRIFIDRVCTRQEW